jgi:lysophospholipase L1-like esterase
MRRNYDWRTALLLLAVWLGTAASLELGLRLLEPAGLARWIGACQRVSASTPLHHAPAAGRARQQLGQGATYGVHAGMQYEEFYDDRGIKHSLLRPQEGEGTKVLFMGDSFIQGYDDANTIPQRAYEWVIAHSSGRQSLIVLNAAYSSYSPVIFTVQANRLIPELRPDFVVIDIDETDLFDDAVRYRGLEVRDDRGRIIAVRQDPRRQAFLDGCARAGDSSLYLSRLIGTLYFRLRLSLYDAQARRSERLFAVAETRDSESSPDLREQMQYFSTTLDELFATVKEHLPADRILVVRHPHLRHLQKDGNGTPIMNRRVGALVGAAAARQGIIFFDAQDELAARFGDHPESYYWNGDMHFNFDGMRAYGELVGRELLRKMEKALEGEDEARPSANRATGRV